MKRLNNWPNILRIATLFGLILFCVFHLASLPGLKKNGSIPPASYQMATGVWAIEPAVSLVHEAGFQRLIQQNPDGDKLVLGGNYTLESGEVLNGSLIVLGGNAQIREEATVNGDVVVLGGTLSIDGLANGDVFILAGLGELGTTAVVRGDVTSVSGNLRLDPGAQIEGRLNENVTSPVPLPLPGSIETPSVTSPVVVNDGLSIWDGLFFLFRSFMWAALAILVVLFFPKNTKRTADTVVSSTIVAGGLGILTALVAPIILVVVAITIIGLPVSLFAALVLGVAWAFGMVVIGVETGNRLGRFANQEWALPVSAGIGTFLVTVVVNGIGEVIPCVGWLVPLLVGSVGLGAVLLTVFGTRPYPLVLVRQAHADNVNLPEMTQIPSALSGESPLDDHPSQTSLSDEP